MLQFKLWRVVARRRYVFITFDAVKADCSFFDVFTVIKFDLQKRKLFCVSYKHGSLCRCANYP